MIVFIMTGRIGVNALQVNVVKREASNAHVPSGIVGSNYTMCLKAHACDTINK